MGATKDFDRRIRQGGDDAIAAVEEYVAEQERLVAQVESMLQRACDRHWKEWIPVEERLPEVDENVLASAAGEVGIAHRYVDGWYWDVDEWHKPFTPTHWMPLPEPPEEAT